MKERLDKSDKEKRDTEAALTATRNLVAERDKTLLAVCATVFVGNFS